MAGDSMWLEVLKWVGIVLAAGFVGYFGRYLAMILIEKMHRKKAETPSPVQQTARPVDSTLELEKQKAKVEKKRAKAEAKKAKKEGKE